MMLNSDEPSSVSGAFRISTAWDVVVPVAAAAIPAGIFALMGFVTEGLDKPNAEPSAFVVFAMSSLQVLGIVAMAVVVLTRFDSGTRQLSMRTNGRPSMWRKGILVLSLVFVLLFDLFLNMASGLAGAEFFLVLAVPAFVMYLLCYRAAFAGLPRS